MRYGKAIIIIRKEKNDIENLKDVKSLSLFIYGGKLREKQDQKKHFMLLLLTEHSHKNIVFQNSVFRDEGSSGR